MVFKRTEVEVREERVSWREAQGRKPCGATWNGTRGLSHHKLVQKTPRKAVTAGSQMSDGCNGLR